MQNHIPERIIQTGSHLQLPLRHRAVSSNIRLLNPTYDYQFFDDAQVATFVKSEFPHYRAIFDSFHYPIQRYDFFRYLAVYRYGGFYFDLDVLLASELSPLLECGCVFSFEALTVSLFLRDNLGMDWLLGNYAFGAAPKHLFLEAIIDNCVRGQRDPNWVKPMMRGSPPLLHDDFFILNSTGPGLVSRTMAENPELAQTVTVLLPEDVADVRNWNHFGEFGIHLADSSWRPKRPFVPRKIGDYCWRWIQRRRIEAARNVGKSRYHRPSTERTPEMRVDEAGPSVQGGQSGCELGGPHTDAAVVRQARHSVSGPQVSILIPAHNADQWIGDAIRSAVSQTWDRKEIVVVDDGSADRTLAIARRLESKLVRVVRQEWQGAAAARNYAVRLSQGDYIQYLDADDLLAPDKIDLQLAALRGHDSRRVLLSSPWAPFYYRPNSGRVVNNSLCQDLCPVEWLLRKMGQNLHMQPATWLTSRELIDAAGPWDTRLAVDDDGEYFCRVLLASEGTRFVPEARTFYRSTPRTRLSYIDEREGKREALLLSMKLHIHYLRSLEESERVRNACAAYLQVWYGAFYPERPDLVAELQALAASLRIPLEPPRLRAKYRWIEPLFGRKAGKWAQTMAPQVKLSLLRRWDRAMYEWDPRRCR